MIHVIATIEVKPSKRAEFLKEFHALMPKVHAEAGCIEYGPAIDMKGEFPVPVPFRDNVVTVIEKWENAEALKAHLGAAHMTEYRQRVKDLVAGVQLQVLEPA